MPVGRCGDQRERRKYRKTGGGRGLLMEQKDTVKYEKHSFEYLAISFPEGHNSKYSFLR